MLQNIPQKHSDHARVFQYGGMKCTCVYNFSALYSKTFVLTKLNRHVLKRTVTHSSALTTKSMAKSVGENYNFPKEEENILEFWKRIDAFKTSLKLSEGKER